MPPIKVFRRSYSRNRVLTLFCFNDSLLSEDSLLFKGSVFLYEAHQSISFTSGPFMESSFIISQELGQILRRLVSEDCKCYYFQVSHSFVPINLNQAPQIYHSFNRSFASVLSLTNSSINSSFTMIGKLGQISSGSLYSFSSIFLILSALFPLFIQLYSPYSFSSILHFHSVIFSLLLQLYSLLYIHTHTLNERM